MQKQAGNEGEEQLSALLLKLRKLLVWVVNADQFLLYPNLMLVLHLQDYRPDSMLSPNFSLGFNDSTLDLLNNAYTIQARKRTDLHRHRPRPRMQKSGQCLAAPHHEGRRAKWYRTLGLDTGSTHSTATRSFHTAHPL